MFNRIYCARIAELEAQVEKLEGDLRWANYKTKTQELINADLRQICEKQHKELMSTRQINVDLLSGRIQWLDKNTGEWKSHKEQ